MSTAEAAIQPSVAEGILRVPHAYVNWSLLDDADGVTIVDAGLPRHWDLLPKALQRIGRRLDDVRALVLTHGHYDPVGFAEPAPPPPPPPPPSPGAPAASCASRCTRRAARTSTTTRCASRSSARPSCTPP